MKKGFTLIELLGVIVIIGILALIAFPPILKQINNTRNGINEATDKIIIDAAKDYYESNKENYRKIDGISYCISINKLVEKNYLNEKLKDDDLNDINISKQVKLTYQNNLFNYKIVEECETSLIRNGIEVPLEQEVLEDGLYESETEKGRIIYRGENPNNYLELIEKNDEPTLYRIISYEEDGTIKVIRNESIGTMPWDERTSRTTGHRKNSDNSYCDYIDYVEGDYYYYGCNAWGNQNNTYYEGNLLNTLSNSFYYKYYPNNTTNFLSQSQTNKTVIENSTLNTYLNEVWLIETNLSNRVTEHKFYVGGIYYYREYTGGDKGLEKEKYEQNLNTWNGKIGLINITEMVESSLNPSCTSVYSNYYGNTKYYYKNEGSNAYTQHNTSNNWPCKYNNWMFSDITEWSISPYSNSSSNVWNIISDGSFNENAGVYAWFDVRPVFFLKPSTILSGSGTSLDPYKIKA